MDLNYTELATRWRQEQPPHLANAGYVMIYAGEVYGWKKSLDEVASEKPGAVAVGIDGQVSIAQGGDDANGAQTWAQVETRSPPRKRR